MDFLKAIRHNETKKLEKKLNKGFNPSATITESVNGRNIETIPLCLAIARGNMQIVDILIKHGANVHQSNLDWASPIHTATFHGNGGIMRLLLAQNVNCNDKDQHGDTPLHIACRKQNSTAVDILLRANNVDLSIQNDKNETALDIANLKGNSEIIGLLKRQLMASSSISRGGSKKQSRTYDPVLLPRSDIDVFQIQTPNSYENTKPHSYENLDLSNLSEKERLEKQLFVLQVKEINDDINLKQNEVERLTQEIEDGKDETQKLKSTIKKLERQLKEKEHAITMRETMKIKLTREITKLQQKKELVSKKGTADIKEDSLECPICFELPLPPLKVFQCKNGHVYCENCKNKPRMDVCPQCRVTLSKAEPIRNIVFEEIISEMVKSNK